VLEWAGVFAQYVIHRSFAARHVLDISKPLIEIPLAPSFGVNSVIITLVADKEANERTRF